VFQVSGTLPNVCLQVHKHLSSPRTCPNLCDNSHRKYLWVHLIATVSSVSNSSGLPGFGPGWNRPQGPGQRQEHWSNPNRRTNTGLLPGLGKTPQFFGWVAPRLQFHLTAHATLPPIEYLSSDCIVTLSICWLFRISPSFTSRFQICDPTNSHRVAVKKHTIQGEIDRFWKAT